MAVRGTQTPVTLLSEASGAARLTHAPVLLLYDLTPPVINILMTHAPVLVLHTLPPSGRVDCMPMMGVS